MGSPRKQGVPSALARYHSERKKRRALLSAAGKKGAQIRLSPEQELGGALAEQTQHHINIDAGAHVEPSSQVEVRTPPQSTAESHPPETAPQTKRKRSSVAHYDPSKYGAVRVTSRHNGKVYARIRNSRPEPEKKAPIEDDGMLIVDVGQLEAFTVALSNGEFSTCPRCNRGPLMPKFNMTGAFSSVDMTCGSCDDVVYTNPLGKKCKGKARGVTSEQLILAVLGALSAGQGYSTLYQLWSVMGIPPPSKTAFHNAADTLRDVIIKYAEESVVAAQDELVELLREGSDDVHSIEGREYYGAVLLADGAWGKRSRSQGSGTSDYGMASVMSDLTRKIIAYDVRQRSCVLCQRGCPKEKHECPKNWDASPQAMEADILSKKLLELMVEKGIIGRHLVMDGDCATIKHLGLQCADDELLCALFKLVTCASDVGHVAKAFKKKVDKEWAAMFGMKKKKTAKEVFETKHISQKNRPYLEEKALEMQTDESQHATIKKMKKPELIRYIRALWDEQHPYEAAAAAEARLPHTLTAAQAAPSPAPTVPSSPQTQAAGEDAAASSPAGAAVTAGANAMTSSDAGAPTSPTPPTRSRGNDAVDSAMPTRRSPRQATRDDAIRKNLAPLLGTSPRNLATDLDAAAGDSGAGRGAQATGSQWNWSTEIEGLCDEDALCDVARDIAHATGTGDRHEMRLMLDGWRHCVDLPAAQHSRGQTGAKLKGMNQVLTHEHTCGMGYYISTAITANRPNKEAVRDAFRALPGHWFDSDHSLCGDWCKKKNGDESHVPARLVDGWLSPEYIDAHPEVFHLGEKLVRDIIEVNYLAEAKLNELYVGLTTSPIESFNNMVSRYANKRIYLGQAWTYRMMVAIAVLMQNVGPTWVTEVKRRMSIGVSKISEELLEREESRRKTEKAYSASDHAKARKAKKHKTLPKRPGKNATDRYAGNSEYVGARASAALARPHQGSASHAVNPDDKPLGGWAAIHDDDDEVHSGDDWGDSDEENPSP